MGQMGEFVPGGAPLNEAYWEALLRDEGHGGTAPVTAQEPWGGASVDGSGTAEATEPGHGEDAWKGARQAMEQGQVLQLPVVGCNRGGVLVGWNGLRGFVPASHLVDLSPSADEEERYDELRRLVGTRLCLKVIELDPALGRFVLSERASRFDESRRQDLLDRLCPGDICQGRVTNLCSFGAFVDLGGLEGLVHVSELSWGRVEHPGDLLQPSQPVEVYVLNVDRERRRVGLSIKRLQPDPWQSVEERYQVGQVVTGCITHIVNFGAFARVEDGLEGLIHISELAEGDFLHPRNVVREGDAVTARVINIDSERRRMGLSLRQVEESVQDDQKGKEGTGASESLAGYPH